MSFSGCRSRVAICLSRSSLFTSATFPIICRRRRRSLVGSCRVQTEFLCVSACLSRRRESTEAEVLAIERGGQRGRRFNDGSAGLNIARVTTGLTPGRRHAARPRRSECRTFALPPDVCPPYICPLSDPNPSLAINPNCP